jgi:hypothetical protein
VASRASRTSRRGGREAGAARPEAAVIAVFSLPSY